MEAINSLADQIVKALLKAKTRTDIDNVLLRLKIDDAKDFIKLLVARLEQVITLGAHDKD